MTQPQINLMCQFILEEFKTRGKDLPVEKSISFMLTTLTLLVTGIIGGLSENTEAHRKKEMQTVLLDNFTHGIKSLLEQDIKHTQIGH